MAYKNGDNRWHEQVVLVETDPLRIFSFILLEIDFVKHSSRRESKKKRTKSKQQQVKRRMKKRRSQTISKCRYLTVRYILLKFLVFVYFSLMMTYKKISLNMAYR